MSEATAAQASAQGTEGDKGGQSGTYTPPATQDEMNRIIADRLSRVRAQFADYDDLKAKATAHDALVEAQKTEAQKLAERLAEAEAKVQGFETEKTVAALRKEVADASGVPIDALRGNTKEDLETHAATLKALIAPSEPAPVPKGAIGPYVPTEGTLPGAPPMDAGQQFAQFLQKQMQG